MVSVLRYYDETRNFSQVDASQVSNIPAAIPSGTTMLFVQATAPTGWTRLTTFNDALLRIVGSGTPGSGGSNGFVGSFNGQTVTTQANNTGSGTSGGTSLSIANLAAHTHTYTVTNEASGTVGGTCHCPTVFNGTAASNTGSNGSGTAHTHTVPSLSIPSLGVNYVGSILYVDALYASKN